MTRFGMFSQSQFKAKSSVPGLSVNVGLTLYDQSVAEQRIEQRTGAVKRTATIALDPNSTTGQYALPADTKSIDGLWYAPAGMPPMFYQVQVVTPDYWRQWTMAENPQRLIEPVVPPMPGQNIEMIAMVEFGVLNITPMAGVTGNLTLRYRPYLTPYSPDDPIWLAYGADPEPAMRTHGLDDDSLKDAIDGIVQYCAAQMLRAAPGGLELHRRSIMEMEAAFERSIWVVARATVGPIENTPQRLRPVGARF